MAMKVPEPGPTIGMLLDGPLDFESLRRADDATTADPQAYASLLERAALQSNEPAAASHWLAEAAGIHLDVLGDLRRALWLIEAAHHRNPHDERAQALFRRTLVEQARASRAADDLTACGACLDRARSVGPRDPKIEEAYARTVLDRVRAGHGVSAEARREAAAILVSLARKRRPAARRVLAELALELAPANKPALALCPDAAPQRPAVGSGRSSRNGVASGNACAVGSMPSVSSCWRVST
jgi:hypothetical protein